MSFIAPLFRRSTRPEVRPGCCFRRDHNGRVTEKVTVIELKNDPAGIPHVRFEVTFERRFSDRVERGLKVLALDTFLDCYGSHAA
jgi:hypothetical protein